MGQQFDDDRLLQVPNAVFGFQQDILKLGYEKSL
jgi:hypothetical protein